MLFDSSIRKELARSFGATLVVLVTVVMTMMLIRTPVSNTQLRAKET